MTRIELAAAALRAAGGLHNPADAETLAQAVLTAIDAADDYFTRGCILMDEDQLHWWRNAPPGDFYEFVDRMWPKVKE